MEGVRIKGLYTCGRDQAGACGENADVLVPRVFKLVLAVERTTLPILREFQDAIVVLAQACSSQKFKDCACGKCTGLPV